MEQYKIYTLGDVLNLDLDVEPVDPTKIYDMVGVYSYGRGLFSKGDISGSDTSYKKFYRLSAKHFVFSQLFGWEGAISLVDAESSGKYVSSQFPTFSANEALVDMSYLSWWFRQKNFWDYLKGQAKGMGDRRRTLNPEIILSARIELPDLNTQREISNKIETVTRKFDLIQQLSEENTHERLSLLISMSHRNDLSEQEKITQGWKLTKLADVLTQVSNPVDVEMGEHYPHFGIYGFAKGLFAKAPLDGSEIKAKKLYRAESGYFMYSRLKAFEGAFGVVPESLHDHYVSNEFPCFLVDGDHLNNEFLAAYLMSPSVWRQLAIHSKGVGARRERLKPVNFLDYEIWLPPLAWQQKIKQVSEKLAAVRTEREKNMQKLDALLPAILDKAFKGEL